VRFSFAAVVSRAALLLNALLLSACAILGPGYIGPIQNPVLDIPVLVTDLRAVQYGDQIIAFFTIPKLSTEGKELKSVRAIDLYAGPGGPGSDDPNSWFHTATHYSVPPAPGSATLVPGPYEYRFAAQPWIGKDLVLRVRSTGPKGRQSLWSLPPVLPVTAPIPQPMDVMAESRKEGVHLTWKDSGKGSGTKYRILRYTGAAAPEPLGETDQLEYLDDSAQFGTAYQYLVLAFADDRHQSAISDPLKTPIVPKDTFPPDLPAGVTANPGVSAIEVQWDLNTEADFKGYNVFRSVDNAPFVKVASLITAPTYHDTDVQPGKSYRYQVSAVDLLDNESARSEPVPATLQ
jgi:hypothetical protein